MSPTIKRWVFLAAIWIVTHYYLLFISDLDMLKIGIIAVGITLILIYIGIVTGTRDKLEEIFGGQKYKP